MAMRICVNCGADLSVIRVVACCDDPLPDDIVEGVFPDDVPVITSLPNNTEALIRLIKLREAKNEDFDFLAGVNVPGDMPGMIRNDAIRAYHGSVNHAMAMFSNVCSLGTGWSWGRDHVTGEFISVRNGPGHETVTANERDPARSMLILCLMMIDVEVGQGS